MEQNEMRARTKAFAIKTIRLTESLPHSVTGHVIRRQLVRCGTSVGANYRAACRARSKADFISKLGIVLEEADESLYWMELLQETCTTQCSLLAELMNEANQLVSILTASIKTAKAPC